MPNIVSLDSYLAADRRKVSWYRNTTTAVLAAKPYTLFHVAGSPGATTFTRASTGALVTGDLSGEVGLIGLGSPAFTSANLTGLTLFSTLATTLQVMELQGYVGTFTAPGTVSGITGGPITTSVTYNAVPSYNENQLIVNAVTAMTGAALSINITYTNQSGVAGRTTGVQATGITTAGACYRMTLQDGDTGVQSIQSVISSSSTGGTFNVLIAREIATAKTTIAGGGVRYNFADLGLPSLSGSSALFLMLAAVSTTLGASTVELEFTGT